MKFKSILYFLLLSTLSTNICSKSEQNKQKRDFHTHMLVTTLAETCNEFLETKQEEKFYNRMYDIYVDSHLSPEKFLHLMIIFFKYHGIQKNIAQLSKEEQSEYFSTVWYLIEDMMLTDIHIQVSIAADELLTHFTTENS